MKVVLEEKDRRNKKGLKEEEKIIKNLKAEIVNLISDHKIKLNDKNEENKKCKAEFDKQKSNRDQKFVEMTQDNQKVKEDFEKLKSVHNRIIIEINQENEKQIEIYKMKLKANDNEIKFLTTTIEEKNKVELFKLVINHESDIFKLIDNKNGSF